MGQKDNFTIPKVCQENWLQMNPTEKARFCNLCQKNVFDFSENSNENFEEIVCLRHTLEPNKNPKNKLFKAIKNLIIKKK